MTEHSAEHPPTKALLYIGAFVGIWLLLNVIVLGKFGITSGWPAFITLPLLFLAGADPKQIPNLFVGGGVGLLTAAAVVPVIGFLGKSGIPIQVAGLLIVFFIVFVIIGLGGMIPVVFNNYNFIYFSIALIFPEQETVKWLGTLIIDGAIFMGAILFFVQKILPKLMSLKAEA